MQRSQNQPHSRAADRSGYATDSDMVDIMEGPYGTQARYMRKTQLVPVPPPVARSCDESEFVPHRLLVAPRSNAAEAQQYRDAAEAAELRRGLHDAADGPRRTAEPDGPRPPRGDRLEHGIFAGLRELQRVPHAPGSQVRTLRPLRNAAGFR
ncbi:hypothetical protein L596_023723 [Steinernema carpocapsae]|uniref:Uncharacterized protein n=1 Tax=Steinernema carpocapsae TaxID=34508 RepID=A0A4U5MEK2_STECR|nr:hypothetical protein L596_023723 [Steinernema carpocapsae]